ncbi:recombination regulator RecX [Leuconostocaceae bacterium ESL0958]|nr:recombination regulator RecX [Leuconostocaceae bacterium ESL0958]
MKKITRISTQKRAGRYNIELDGHFAFGLSEAVLAKFGLMKGRTLDEALIAQIKEADQVDQALKIALNYLSPALRTVAQVRQKLSQKEVSAAIADQVVDYLQKQQLLDDASYAQHYVATKKRIQPKGPRVIAQDLHQAGVAEATIESALLSYSAEEQLAVAVKLAEKAARSHRRDAALVRRQKVTQALVQKGFSFEIAEEALTAVTVEADANEEAENALRQAEKMAHRQRRLSPKARYYQVKQKLYAKGFRGTALEQALDQIDWEATD